MSKLKMPTAQPYEPSPRPLLPCPTSPMQQTESESWEHTRQPSEWDSYRNDHIDDRFGDKR